MSNKLNVLNIFDSVVDRQILPNGLILYSFQHQSSLSYALHIIEKTFQQTTSFTFTESTLFNTPDFLLINYEEASIKVEDIRNINDRIKYGPHRFTSLFVCINQAQLMTNQAANSFLKMLEEPPQNVFFILISPNPKSLLPTIQSRCQSIYCPLNQDLNAQYGQLLPQKNICTSADMSNYQSFSKLPLLKKFDWIQSMSSQKKTCLLTLESWISALDCRLSCNRHTQILILDILNALQFQTNTRLQLERLIYSEILN